MSEVSAFSIYRTEQRHNKSEPIITKKIKKTPKKLKESHTVDNDLSKEEMVNRMIEQKKNDLSRKRLSKKMKIDRKKMKRNSSLNSSSNSFVKDRVVQSTPISKKRRTESFSINSDSSSSIIETNGTINGSGVERNVIQKNTAEDITEYNSVEVGKKLFEWVISPIKHEIFFKKYWEKTPLFIQRKKGNYFSSLVSIKKIDTMLRQNHIEFTKNIDITSYENGVRSTHNPEGRALPPVVWDFYNNGCSIRLLNPQTYIPQIFSLDATLQEYFQCMTGTNLYLTPPNSQGFAPHYDDIEAFVLQIEGKKRWKVYAPRTNTEKLPRYSSHNFQQNEIGKPIAEVVLEPGDILYFPRGFIHQATTVEGHHSLHITLSVYQKNSWADLMEAIVPAALSRAIDNDEEFRQGLPLNVGSYMGLVFSDQPSEQRTQVLKKVRTLFNKLFENADVDDGIDQVYKKFQHDALPPDISEADRQRTVYGCNMITNDAGEIKIPFVIELDTSLRLIRANCLRVVREAGALRVYFSVDNSKEYHEYSQEFIEIDSTDAPILEFLIRCYPNYSKVSDFPVDDDDRKLNVATDLWEKGLLMSEHPIQL